MDGLYSEVFPRGESGAEAQPTVDGSPEYREEKRTLPRWIEEGFLAGPSCRTVRQNLGFVGMMTRTWICLVAIFLSNLSVVEWVCEDDAACHSVVLRILYLGASVDAAVIRHSNLALQVDSSINQDLEIGTGTTSVGIRTSSSKFSLRITTYPT